MYYIKIYERYNSHNKLIRITCITDNSRLLTEEEIEGYKEDEDYIVKDNGVIEKKDNNNLYKLIIYPLSVFVDKYFEQGYWSVNDNNSDLVLVSDMRDVFIKINDWLTDLNSLTTFNLTDNGIGSTIWQYYDKDYKYKYYSATKSAKEDEINE